MNKNNLHQPVNTLQRSIDLPQGKIFYELELKLRKTVGIYIKNRRVIVRAPSYVTQKDIDNFLIEKSAWIWKKIHEKPLFLEPIHWSNGCSIAYLGHVLNIKINTDSTKTTLCGNGYLQVGLAQRARVKVPPALSDVVQEWMKRQALELFEKKSFTFGLMMGVKAKTVGLTSAKTRWGSANTNGDIRLHWRLMQLPYDLIDYVVVHELAHLKEMNHGTRFWEIVAGVLPDFIQRRALLKKVQLKPWQ